MIAVQNVSKVFPGVKALDNVCLHVKPGEVHGLVGENGAGKSTFIKILSGIYCDYQGDVFIDGHKICFLCAHDAQRCGVATIFQELTSVPVLSVAENMFLGREPTKKMGVVDFKEMKKICTQTLSFLESDIDPSAILGKLSVAKQQVVEICKALVLNSQIIIMDEPTSSLGESEVEELFILIDKLKERGITILYVSHKLDEIFKICDSISVFRDGQHVGTKNTQETNSDEIIRMMVGRSLNMLFPEREMQRGDVVLSVRNVCRKNEFKDVSFDLHAGEIVGFSGLIGAGRTELAKALIGATKIDSGEIEMYGKAKHFRHPQNALSAGMAYLSEDRKGEGLMLELSVRENVSISSLNKIVKKIFINKNLERESVKFYSDKFRIKMVNINQVIESLSGGNQQKVIISRLLMTDSSVLIFDEPTRGIDVGAKYEIYKIMNDLTREGKAIIFISSELPEVLGISDRVMCMVEGELVKTFDKTDAEPERVMHVLTGGAST